MSIFNTIPILGGILDKLAGRLLPDKGESRAAQARINEAEVSGAPVSILRLWRGFLGFVLSLVFAWEVVARPVITTYWPEAVLPPSMLKEVSTLLLSMLGLGF